MAISSTEILITGAVRRLYETYPYPRYPLLAKPRWQEGYLCSSLFAGRLAEQNCGASQSRGDNGAQQVLVVGAGEVLPYVMRKVEPPEHRLVCVDLSSASLMRARVRLLTSFRSADFVAADVNDYLQDRVSDSFRHIDAYGVLHHLANPGPTLKLLAGRLRPGGTMRLMLYNSRARRWIHQLQRALAVLGLDPYSETDLDQARKLLGQLAKDAPAIGQRLSQMGSQTLRINARLVDTFFHAREARLSVGRWWELISQADLEIVGLFDRYCELDDLENPLWQVPTAAELEERCEDYRFENNLELFLRCKSDRDSKSSGVVKRPSGTRMMASPPRSWFAYGETCCVPGRLRRRLWLRHVDFARGIDVAPLDMDIKCLDLQTLQRLARIGVLFPGQFTDRNTREMLKKPMESRMESPERAACEDLAGSPVERLVEELLRHRGRYSSQRLKIVMQRLIRAQD